MSFHKAVSAKSDVIALHDAALLARAAMDAIPSDLDVYSESDQIQAAIAPADAIALRILATSISSKDWTAASRATAWLDGADAYWKIIGVAA